MLRLYTDSRMLDHVPHPHHPERPERLAAVIRHLERTGQKSQCEIGVPRLATDEELCRVHTAAHVRRMQQQALAGGGQVEADTWLSAGSETAARLAAGTVIEAIAGVVQGGDQQAFCLVRPPGHHAQPDSPMGFCVYASVAAGAAAALDQFDLNRILIVDCDFHHGNGTQEIFYERGEVGFFSIHRHPFYPGSGDGNETGSGAGLGSTLNVPVRFGTDRTAYMRQFAAALESFADRVRPELILISAGFDAHAEDPVGNLGLEIEDFGEMTNVSRSIAATHAQGRIVSVLEGGYNPARLAGCVSEHIYQLLRE